MVRRSYLRQSWAIQSPGTGGDRAGRAPLGRRCVVAAKSWLGAGAGDGAGPEAHRAAGQRRAGHM